MNTHRNYSRSIAKHLLEPEHRAGIVKSFHVITRQKTTAFLCITEAGAIGKLKSNLRCESTYTLEVTVVYFSVTIAFTCYPA